MKKIILLTFFIAFFSGCKMSDIIPSSGGNNVKEEITITKNSVSITSFNRKKIHQKKHGVSISVEPIRFFPELWYKIKLSQRFAIIMMDNFTETKTPFYKNPSHLAFRIKISNNSNRVFRAKNAILTFSVDGGSISVHSDRYKNLANAIIVPNSSKIITVYGPDTKLLQNSKGVMHIGMYDVMTGNVISNFEWYFKYKVKTAKVKHLVEKMGVRLSQQGAYIRDGAEIKAK
jgi:hypothetical protein